MRCSASNNYKKWLAIAITMPIEIAATTTIAERSKGEMQSAFLLARIKGVLASIVTKKLNKLLRASDANIVGGIIFWV